MISKWATQFINLYQGIQCLTLRSQFYVFKILCHLSWRFLPPPKYNGGEWYFVCVSKTERNSDILPEKQCPGYSGLSRRHRELFSLELLSTEEIVPLKTIDGSLCGLAWVTGRPFLTRDVTVKFSLNVIFNATNEIAFSSIALMEMSKPRHINPKLFTYRLVHRPFKQKKFCWVYDRWKGFFRLWKHSVHYISRSDRVSQTFNDSSSQKNDFSMPRTPEEGATWCLVTGKNGWWLLRAEHNSCRIDNHNINTANCQSEPTNT